MIYVYNKVTTNQQDKKMYYFYLTKNSTLIFNTQ